MRASFPFWFGLAILGIVLYAIVGPRIGYRDEGYHHEPRVDINGGIKSALGQYNVDNGQFPKSLQDLVRKPDGATNWHGPYLEKIPIDPWGDPYIYEFPGKHNSDGYDLFSAGRDGKTGTDDDIGNWQ